MAVPAVCGEDIADMSKWSKAPGLMVVMVAEPVFVEPVTTNVNELPATVGVTVTLESTPAVNAAEVPVIPAVPL